MNTSEILHTSKDMKSPDESFLYKGARGAAIRILSRFERSDSYLDKLLEYELRVGELSIQDKALLTEIVNGTTRWMGKLDWVLTGFYHGEFDKCLTPIKNAMRIALYQIMFLNKIPHAAAINESVEIIKRIKGDKSAGIVNGVLRNITRNLDNIRYPNPEEDKVWYYSVIYSHPKWLVKHWMDIMSEEQLELFLQANIARPILTLRVNTLKSSVDIISQWLDEHSISYTLSELHKNSIFVSSLRDISSSDIFKEGLVTVQDSSASMAALLTHAQPGMTVIDLCAAPGGKSFYVAEQMNNKGSVLALDKYEAKMRFLSEGAQRLGIDIIQPIIADATSFQHEQVDIVMADVPCSGFGTLSKKPDIKWKRDQTDIARLIPLQREILNHAASLVKPGGVLVYSTCTIEPKENQENIEWFLEQHSEFYLDDAGKYLPSEICFDGYMKTIPGTCATDGAFAARLVKH
jgi:16S rRNA (cytosine967-C5)-methyltransferase